MASGLNFELISGVRHLSGTTHLQSFEASCENSSCARLNVRTGVKLTASQLKHLAVLAGDSADPLGLLQILTDRMASPAEVIGLFINANKKDTWQLRIN